MLICRVLFCVASRVSYLSCSPVIVLLDTSWAGEVFWIRFLKL